MVTVVREICSCPIFKRAGEAFDLRIRAMAWESVGDVDYHRERRHAKFQTQ